MKIEVFKDDQPVYAGPWEQAPDEVAAYIRSAEAHHGTDNLEAYLRTKGTPVALAMRGYGLRVL